MTDIDAVRERYRSFARQQAAGISPTFHDWALAAAGDSDLLTLIATLPTSKQQPNLVFAAARIHGAVPGDGDSLHDVLITRWADVQATVLLRSTQTNEAARCAAILLGLQNIPGRIALLEVGAAAGLCLVPDRYSYTFDDGSRLDPADGPSSLTIPIAVRDGLTPPTRMPEITWRAGLDLNPLDPADPHDRAWLEALVWPEQDDRRARLTVAAQVAAANGVRVQWGDLLTDLPALADSAPNDATLVVTHSATLAYLDEEQRHSAIAMFTGLPARRISFEARGVDPSTTVLEAPSTPRTLFVAALDTHPYAVADGHGTHLGPPVV